MTTINLNREEIATVLAALRFYQLHGINSTFNMEDIASDGGEIEPLTYGDIDNLCERINFAPSAGLPPCVAHGADLDEARARFPVEDWTYEIANGDTRLGYDVWLEHKVESQWDALAGRWID